MALQHLPMGAVGDEHRAGQAGVALVAGLQRWQHAPPVGQEPVCAAEQVQAVVVVTGQLDAGAVSAKLRGGQERLLGVFVAGGDVVHGHRRGGVSGIALQDMDWQAEFGQHARVPASAAGVVGRGDTFGGALVHTLQDRSDAEQVVGHVEVPVGHHGASVGAAGALAVAADVVALARDAECSQVQPADAAEGAGRDVPAHAVVAEVRERMPEGGEFPIEHRDHARLGGVEHQVVEPEVLVGDRPRPVVVGEVRLDLLAEAAGDVDVLMLDKTGTITYGNRQATGLIVAHGVDEQEAAEIARVASVADETPEGRSIVSWLTENYHLSTAAGEEEKTAEVIPFSASTRMSGLDLRGRKLRKGAGDAVRRWVTEAGGDWPQEIEDSVTQIAEGGGTPLPVAVEESDGTRRVIAVVQLSDVVKPGMAERFAELRQMGIKTIMVTGDNPLTAAAIAKEAGVDDYIAEATPEDKLARIREEQAHGRMVAMTGDGTNDAPALAQADVGVAMNTGTSAAKEAANMVDLDSDPTKLIDVVRIGKQLLITRGALTTFSLANDLAKYFAILPALFSTQLPHLERLNVMHLHSPQSAIVSAVVFNALIIVALIPLALKGVAYKPASASSLLRRNLGIWGLGGVITPFLGIWLIDQVVNLLPGI